MVESNGLTCDHELLRQSLSDALPEAREEELARHLSACSACRQELERMAAEEADWLKVGAVLKREAESSQPTAPFYASPAALAADPFADVEIAADFAVDFLEPSRTPESIGRLADIDILEVIGQGGMGIVLKGYQAELKRLVAVKALAPHLAVSGAARKRFAREAQAAAAILHPNVIPILTVHSAGKLPFLVMPYLACESLQQRIAREGPLALPDILRIGMQTASGLAAAHAQGLVHRDVKPANILLEKGVERVMLTDFGLARAVDDASITCTGIIAGTPQFMSPEQARGEPVDARSDMFSLGSVLYTMAAGRPPFRAETTFGILRRITDTEPRPIREINPEMPDWLAAVIAKLHAKVPIDRYQSAEEVARLLESCLAHLQQPAAVPLPSALRSVPKPAAPLPGWDRVAGWRERLRWLREQVAQRRAASAALIACAILAAGVIVGMAVRIHRDAKAPAIANPPSQRPNAARSEVDPVEGTVADDSGDAWDDGVPQRLTVLKQEIEQLERQTGRQFEVLPSAKRPEKSDHSNQHPVPEIKK